MKIKEFIKLTKEALGIEPSNKDIKKKKQLQELIEKLEENISKIKQQLREESSLKRKEELQEELEIYKVQIQKGKEILEKKLKKK